MKSLITRHIEDHNQIASKCGKECVKSIDNMTQALAGCFLNGGKLFIVGNGASRLLAMYAESLFINKCRMARPALPAVELTSCILTVGQDFDEVYEKHLSSQASSGDMLMALTAEPLYEPVLRALRFAADNDIKSIGLCGRDATAMQGLCDILFAVESGDPLRINEIQLLVLHSLCDRVDDIIFSPNPLGMDQ